MTFKSFLATRPAVRLSLFFAAMLGLLSAAPALAGSFTAAPVVVQFPATAVGVSATAITETITITTSVAANSLSASLHYNSDFNIASGSCTGTGTITCTYSVTFRPTLPGARKDAIFLTSSSGRVATVLLGGIGTSPFAALQSGLISNSSGIATLGTGHYSAPVSDERHNVYFFYNNNLYKSSYLNSPTLLLASATSGDVSAMAIDGAGVLYWGLGSTSPTTAGATLNTYDTIQNLQGTFALPASDLYYSVATDGAGDVFAIASTANTIVKITPAGATTTTAITPAVTTARQAATDPSGDLFFSGGSINEFTAAGVQSQVSTQNAAAGLATDAAATLYVASASGNTIELAPQNYATTAYTYPTLQATTTYGLNVVVDGTLYVGTSGNLIAIDRSQNPLNFPNQVTGVASTTQTVSVLNIGNQPLTYTNIALTGSGFALQTASTAPCTPGIVLAAGASCNLAVNFTAPHAGSYTGSVALTSNSLNVATTNQTIALTATVPGTYVTAAPATINFAGQPIGTTSGNYVVTISNNGLNAATSVTAVSSNSAFSVDTTHSNTSFFACANGVQPAQSCQILVTFNPTAVQSYSGTITVTGVGGSNPSSTTVITVSGNGTPTVVQTSGGSNSTVLFNNAAVGIAPASAQTVTASFTLTGYTALPTSTSAAMHYGTSYTAGTLTCTGGPAVLACSIPVTFLPQYPGARRDAVLVKVNGTLAATIQAYGIGTAPLALLQPGVVTQPIPSVYTGNYFYNSVVGEDGTAYILGTNSQSVTSITKAGVVSILPINFFGLSPQSAAIDGAGTLYITLGDYSTSIITYTADGLQGTKTIAYPPGYTNCFSSNGLYGIAFGVANDLFALDNVCTTVFENKRDGTATATAINPSITQPNFLQVDANEDALFGGYTVNELTPGGTQTQINTTGSNSGEGIDAAGTLYLTRYNTYSVGLLPASSYNTSIAGIGINAPTGGPGVAPDGTVYIGDYSQVDKVDRSQGKFTFNAINLSQVGTPQTATFYNGGNAPLTLTSTTLTGDPNYTLTANGCTNGLVIQPGALCSVTVNFTAPGHGGTFAGNIAFVTNSLNVTTTSNLALLDTVAYPYFTVSPTSLAFGNQGTNSTSPAQSITVTNNGAGLGYVSGSTFLTSGFSASLGSSCSSIAVGASCTISVTFSPTTATAYSTTGTLYTSGGGTNPTFTVTGTGTTSAPAVTLNPTAISFTGGPGSTPPNQTLTITNSGTATLTSLNVVLNATNSNFAIVSNGCGTSLNVNASCAVVISFTNNGAGTSGAYLTINDNAASSPQTVQITSNITAMPVVVISPTVVNFPATAIGSNAITMFVTLTNTGNAILNYGGFTISGSTAATSSFTVQNNFGNPCMAQVGINQSCMFTISFAPTTAGPLTETVTISDNASPATQSFTINGTGTLAAPQLSIVPVALTYAATVGSTSPAQQLLITNLTASAIPALTLSITGTNAANFAQTAATTCTASLAANSSCFATVNFTPPSTGAFTAAFNASTGTTSASSTLTGTGNAFISIPQLQFTPSALTTFAGTGAPCSRAEITAGIGDGGPATSGAICTAFATSVDPSGNVYIADFNFNDVRKVSTGTISTAAGVAAITGGFSGDGGPAPAAGLYQPVDVISDPQGNLYIVDSSNYRIRKVTASTGIISTLYGPTIGYYNGSLSTLPIGQGSIAFDPSGNLYFAGGYTQLVIKVTPAGTASIFAGTQSNAGPGVAGYTGDGGLAYQATLSNPQGVASDLAGNIYIADTNNNVIRKVSAATGIITTYAGNGTLGYTGDGGPATSATLGASYLSTDLAGDLYVTGFSGQQGTAGTFSVVRKITPAGIISTYAGGGTGSAGTTASTASLGGSILGIARVDLTGALIIPDNTLVYSAGGSGLLAFGSRSLNSTTTQTLTLQNTGNAPLVFGTTPYVLSGSSAFTVTSSTCTGSIAIAASCTVSVNFIPTTASPVTASLAFASNAQGGTETASLTGTGVAAAVPQATLTPAFLIFNGTTVNTTAPTQTITLTNSGNATLTISSVAVTGSNAAQFAATTCPATLAPAATCVITISFTPTTTGSISANLAVTDNAAGTTQFAILSGTGNAVGAANAVLTPSALTFASTTIGTTTASQNINLANTGNATLTINSVTIPNYEFNLANNTCGTSLAAGANCNYSISFTPNATGAQSSTLTVSDNIGTQTATLSGTGSSAPAAQAVLAPTALTFASTTMGTTSAAQVITLSNPGNATLTSVLASIPNYEFQYTTTCGTSLAAGASCTYTVTFTPNATGAQSSALYVTDSLGSQSATLSGTGAAAAAPQAVLTSSFSFPATVINTTSAAMNANLTNSGTAALTITSASVSAPFTLASSTCGSSLAAGASCTYSITLTPTTTGAQAGALTVVDSVGTQTTTLSGTGAAAPVAQAVLTPTSLTFPSTFMGTPSAAQVVMLSNPGTATLTGITVSFTGATPTAYAQTSTCGTTLAAGSSCTISVVFTPAASGTYTANLAVANSVATQTATLTGTGNSSTGFTAVAPTPTQSVDPGGVAIYNINVNTLTGNYTLPVTLTATGLPPGATYSFAPGVVTPGTSGAPSILTIQTAASFALAKRMPSPIYAALLLLPLAGFRRARRKLRALPSALRLLTLLLFSLATILPLSGCAGGYFGSAPQAYTITVTGTSSAATQSTTVTLNLQ